MRTQPSATRTPRSVVAKSSAWRAVCTRRSHRNALTMATTQRATRIEREERITALLLNMLSDIELIALLSDDRADQKRLLTILDEVLALKHAAIQRRNKKPGA